MKINTSFKALAMIAGICGVSGIVNAATCSSILDKTGAVNGANGPITATDALSGNSCGHNTNFSGSFAYCGGVSFSTTGTDVWAVHLGASQNFTFTINSSAFVPDVALWSGSCADNAACVNGTEYLATQASAPYSITTATYTGNAEGTYYIVISDSSAVGAQCGAYNLTFSGTLPVKLQKFSVN